MPVRIEQPTATTCQKSGNDPSGSPILSVLTRITYLVRPDGRLAMAPEQLPITEDPLEDESGRLLADLDIYPYKPMTDVVLHGHAHGRGRHQFDVAIAVNEKQVKRIRVIGDRQCAALGGGGIFFGPPAPIDKIPLSYTHAYGGIDRVAEVKGINPFVELARATDLPEAGVQQGNLYRYPRNPIGRGYLMEANVEAVSELELPNLEDPLDLLTPQRLAVGVPGHWYRMPLPQATEWLHPLWFPRLAYLGTNHGTIDNPETIVEIDRGFAPKNILEVRIPTRDDAFRFTCGASLGLQLPYLRGGETITIDNAHPREARYIIRLPGERPKIWVDGRKGSLKPTEPVIHSLIIEPDHDRVGIVWRGSAVALRQYLPTELQKMPLRVELP